MANEYGNYSTIDPLNTRTTTNTHVASQALTNGNRTTAITVADAHQAYTQTLSPGGKYHVEQTCGTWGSDANGGHAIMILCPKSKWEGSTTGPAVVTSAFAFHARTPGGLGFGPITRLSGSNLTTLGTEVANGNRVTYDIDMSTIGSTTVKISIEGSLISTDSSMAFADEEYVMAFNVDNVARSIDFTMNTGSDAFVDTPVTGHVGIGTHTMPTPAVTNYQDHYYIEAGISHTNGATTAVTLPWNTSTYETMVTVKRTDAAGSWYRVDTLRGGTKAAQMEGANGDITNSDGGFSGTSFVITSDYASGTYLLEATKYGLVSATAVNEEGSINTLKTTSNNDSKAFMLTWTGTAENGTLGHGLDVAPDFIVASDTDTDSACDRFVFHKDVPSAGRLFLTAAAPDTNANGWQNTAPTTTLVSIGSGSHNGAGTSVMYGYANSDVFNFGIYTGNGNADGPMINTVGSPKLFGMKANTGTEGWATYSSAWDTGGNSTQQLLQLQSTAAILDNASYEIDILSTGVKIRDAETGINQNTKAHFYYAFGIQLLTDGAINQGRAGAVQPYGQAYGGNTIKRVGNFWVHTFTSSGTFTPVSDGAVDYLVIAGGGGGGGYRGGGGGAGGYRSSWNSETSGGGGSSETALSLTAGTDYTVTIGAGGAGGAHNALGPVGGNSVFSSITSIGGGSGGPADINAGNGGSGGGSSRSDKSAGTGTANQGFAGGAGGTYSSAHAGSGGGGAGEIGVEGNGAGVGGAGGDGVASTISGSSIVRGGGGGGGVHTTNNGLGAGGAGGGGNATASGNGQAGTANTGGGGGAASYTSSYASQTGGAGGSGIVIIRYAIG